MLANILPTSCEVGVLNGQVKPGDVVAVVGAGPIGLSAITASRLFSPSHIIAIDLADARLEAAKQFGADVVINPAHENPITVVRDMTAGMGAEVTIEAVGVPATFEQAVSSPTQAGTSLTSACTASHDPAPGARLDQGPDHHHRTGRHVQHSYAAGAGQDPAVARAHPDPSTPGHQRAPGRRDRAPGRVPPRPVPPAAGRAVPAPAAPKAAPQVPAASRPIRSGR
jgi:NADPH:quinone reductase-like Zn-dependent oxidoreductase